MRRRRRGGVGGGGEQPHSEQHLHAYTTVNPPPQESPNVDLWWRTPTAPVTQIPRIWRVISAKIRHQYCNR